MNIWERYESARETYIGLGVDVDAAVERLKNIPVSMHCQQGGDVTGFKDAGSSSGGIQAMGNYPGKARNPRGLTADIDKAPSLTPGKHRINLRASYVIFTDREKAGRNAPEPKRLAKRVEFARKRGLGLDFNPTMFSHPKAENATLSSKDPETRKFWIDHCKAYACISQYFVEGLRSPCSMNIWIPDGFRDTPADHMSPRARPKDSLDQILAMDYDKSKMLIAVEPEVFGIDMESCIMGFHESHINYAAARGIIYLLDSDHFHPTEMISDKVSSVLPFSGRVALHVSRPVRWDNDHVVLFDNETRETAKEIAKDDPDRVLLALDFSDANINRIHAWVVGMRNMQKAPLYALLMPNEKLARFQEEHRLTELTVEQEELETYPFGDVWDYSCQINQIPVEEQWFKEAGACEKEVLSKHGWYGSRSRRRLIPVT